MSESAESKESQEIPGIAVDVKIWRYGIYWVIALVVIAYVGYFGVFLGQSAAKDAQVWGSFGDFVGGLLNPLVAFAALYWLTESVKIQKQEMAETRRELEKQAKNGRDSVNLAAITALANLHLARVAGLERGLKATSIALAESKSLLDGGDTHEKAEIRRTHESLVAEILACEREYKDLIKSIQDYVAIPQRTK